MISARTVNLLLSGKRILRDVSLDVCSGQIVILCGPNGAGKSTLLSALAGEHAFCAQHITYGDQRLSELGNAALARHRAVLEQHPILSAEFTVDELVRLSAPITVEPRALDTLCDRALNEVGLANLQHRLVSRLSGGQRHRAHFARVLVQLYANMRPGHDVCLLLDEPTASLDLKHQIDALRLVRRLASQGVAALVVLHDLNLAAAFADQIVLMKDGMIAHAGAPVEVVTEANLTSVFDTPIIVERTASGQIIVQPELST